MTDIEQLRRRAQHFLSRLTGEAGGASATPWGARGALAAAMLAGIAIYVWMWEVTALAIAVLLIAAIAVFLGRSHFAVFAGLIWAWSAEIFEMLRWEGRLFAQERLYFDDWLGGTALLAFLMFSFRLLELPRAGAPATISRRLTRGSDESRKPVPNLLLLPWSGAALRLVAAPAAAIAILWLAPWQRFTDNELRLFPSFYRAVMFLWGIGMIGLIAGTAFSALRWRRLTPRQGAIYARWVILNESRREQAAIERARARRLRRRTSGGGR